MFCIKLFFFFFSQRELTVYIQLEARITIGAGIHRNARLRTGFPDYMVTVCLSRAMRFNVHEK